MAETYRFEKVYRKHSDRLLKEAGPFLSGEPRVRRRRVAGEGGVLRRTGQMLREVIPLLKGDLRCDMLIFHDLPTEQGLVHVVHSYARKILLPPEYLMAMDGRIPRAAMLKRRAQDGGVWISALGEQDRGEEFCRFLKGIKRGTGPRADRLFHEARWVQEVGNTQITLDWAMQLAPLGEDRFLFIFKLPYQVGLFGITKFGVEKFLRTANWLKEALDAYDDGGETPRRGVLLPTLALLALPEVAGGVKGE